MGKKSKSKFKKQIKAQLNERLAKLDKVADGQMNPKTVAPIISNNSETLAIGQVQNLPQIKADLLKTGIVVAAMALGIAGLAILDLKYQILLKLGGYLFKIFHIN